MDNLLLEAGDLALILPIGLLCSLVFLLLIMRSLRARRYGVKMRSVMIVGDAARWEWITNRLHETGLCLSVPFLVENENKALSVLSKARPLPDYVLYVPDENSSCDDIKVFLELMCSCHKRSSVVVVLDKDKGSRFDMVFYFGENVRIWVSTYPPVYLAAALRGNL